LATLLSIVSTLGNDDPPELLSAFGAFRQTLAPHLSNDDPETTSACTATHALHFYLRRQGEDYLWSYSEVSSMAKLMLPALRSCSIPQQPSKEAATALAEGCRLHLEACRRRGPFYGCREVCKEFCLFRFSVAAQLEDTELQIEFRKATEGEVSLEGIDRVNERIMERLLLPERGFDASRRLVLCHTIQQAAAWGEISVEKRRKLVDKVINLF
jgi:hypothetical protein